MILKIAGGMLGAFVFANFTMLLSCIFRNAKAASISAVFMAAVLIKLSETYSQVKLLYPIQFGSDAVVKCFFFCGDILLPYMAVVLFLTVAYIGVFAFLLKKIDKKYCI